MEKMKYACPPLPTRTYVVCPSCFPGFKLQGDKKITLGTALQRGIKHTQLSHVVNLQPIFLLEFCRDVHPTQYEAGFPSTVYTRNIPSMYLAPELHWQPTATILPPVIQKKSAERHFNQLLLMLYDCFTEDTCRSSSSEPNICVHPINNGLKLVGQEKNQIVLVTISRRTLEGQCSSARKNLHAWSIHDDRIHEDKDRLCQLATSESIAISHRRTRQTHPPTE